jgi:hypothetical protein
VVGSWPQPFEDGYEGRSGIPVSVVCEGPAREPCETVRGRLEKAGVRVAGGAPQGAIRVLVGPWRSLRGDAAAAQLEEGPEASGVFAEIGGESGCRLEGLDEGGRPARRFGPAAGLVAATRHYEDPPTWVVSGCEEAGVEAAARLLDGPDLRDHYAVAAEGGAATPLPVR